MVRLPLLLGHTAETSTISLSSPVKLVSRTVRRLPFVCSLSSGDARPDRHGCIIRDGLGAERVVTGCRRRVRDLERIDHVATVLDEAMVVVAGDREERDLPVVVHTLNRSTRLAPTTREGIGAGKMHLERRIVARRVEDEVVPRQAAEDRHIVRDVHSIEENRAASGRAFEDAAVEEDEAEVVTAQRAVRRRVVVQERRRHVVDGDHHRLTSRDLDLSVHFLAGARRAVTVPDVTLTPVTASELCTAVRHRHVNRIRRTGVAHLDGEALDRALRHFRRVERLDDRQVDVDQDVDGVRVFVADVGAVARVIGVSVGNDRRVRQAEHLRH